MPASAADLARGKHWNMVGPTRIDCNNDAGRCHITKPLAESFADSNKHLEHSGDPAPICALDDICRETAV
jgi:hypothetical protein